LSADALAGTTKHRDPALPAARHTGTATILLIEDDLANALLIEAVIARHFPDERMLNAMQARIGLDRTLLQLPDLVLLNLMMPGIEGYALLERLNSPGIA